MIALWENPPARQQVLDQVEAFLTCLAGNDQRAARAMLIDYSDVGDPSQDTAWRSALETLWEIVVEWDELEGSSFDGDWLTSLTPPSQLDEDALAQNDLTIASALGIRWDAEGDGPKVGIGDTMHINVCFLGEPTDVTASFRLDALKAGGFGLRMPSFRVW